MSAENELDELEWEMQQLLEAEEVPPEAFYLALKKALTQLEQASPATWS